eukprot:540921-Rhodomonas_salina.1
MIASGYYVHTYTFVIQDAGEAAFIIIDDSYEDRPPPLLAASSSSSEAGSEPGTPHQGTPSGPVNTSDLDVIDVLTSGTAISFIAYVISTWIVFMTWINASDIISTSTSCISYAFKVTATMGVTVANDTTFHICRSNIAAFMQITMTAGWVTMNSAATILGVDLSGKDTRHFLFYYWTATTHFMILWSLYLSLTDYPMPNSRSIVVHDQSATATRAHDKPSPADQDHLSYAYARQATITPNILIAATNALELRLCVDT